MNKSEYILRLDDIKSKYDHERLSIGKQYALSNNPYEIGDKITDHIGSGIITKIQVYHNMHSMPSCVYNVNNLTKSGQISKREPYRMIYQINVISNE